MPTDIPYGERVLSSIMRQCERRGIPVQEADSVLAHIASEEGKRVVKMDARELRNLQRNLGTHMTSYLDGKKRRLGPAQGTWSEQATESAIVEAARGGVAIASIKGTGKGGIVTKDDVLAFLGE